MATNQLNQITGSIDPITGANLDWQNQFWEWMDVKWALKKAFVVASTVLALNWVMDMQNPNSVYAASEAQASIPVKVINISWYNEANWKNFKFPDWVCISSIAEVIDYKTFIIFLNWVNVDIEEDPTNYNLARIAWILYLKANQLRNLDNQLWGLDKKLWGLDKKLWGLDKKLRDAKMIAAFAKAW